MSEEDVQNMLEIVLVSEFKVEALQAEKDPFQGTHTGVPDATKDDSTESETEPWGNDEDDINDENDSESKGNDKENKSDDDKTPFDNENGSDSEQDMNGSESDYEYNEQVNEEEVKDDDEEEDEVVHTPSNFDDEDDANLESRMMIRLKEADVEITNAQQEKEILKITQEQVVEDAYVTISTVAKEIVVPVASSSHSSDLALKFLNFADILPNDAEIVSPLDVHVHHEVPSTHTSTLLTVPVTPLFVKKTLCHNLGVISKHS
nr:hypothetical protein [Tanacetum cinerariifolium]